MFAECDVTVGVTPDMRFYVFLIRVAGKELSDICYCPYDYGKIRMTERLEMVLRQQGIMGEVREALVRKAIAEAVAEASGDAALPLINLGFQAKSDSSSRITRIH